MCESTTRRREVSSAAIWANAIFNPFTIIALAVGVYAVLKLVVGKRTWHGDCTYCSKSKKEATPDD